MLSKLRLASYIVIGIIVFISLVFIIVATLKPKVAGIYIATNPEADVWINGKAVGRTPYRATVKPGETVVKLIPSSYGITLLPYETKVRLTTGVETVIKYDFGATDDASSGEVISFEKIGAKQTSLIAVTIPDSAQLIIDSGSRAFTPHKTSAIVPGEHTLRFSSQGYKDREVVVKTFENYKLTAIVKLAKENSEVLSGNASQTPSPTPTTDPDQAIVEILGTDIGYLRVRSEPNSLSNEIGKVEPGKRYMLLETDERSGWYKIEFEAEKEGWISNDYAKIINKSPTPTRVLQSSTPSATLAPAATGSATP